MRPGFIAHLTIALLMFTAGITLFILPIGGHTFYNYKGEVGISQKDYEQLKLQIGSNLEYLAGIDPSFNEFSYDPETHILKVDIQNAYEQLVSSDNMSRREQIMTAINGYTPLSFTTDFHKPINSSSMTAEALLFVIAIILTFLLLAWT